MMTSINPPYSALELKEAYDAWVNTPHSKPMERVKRFEIYVDIRDGLPIGTTALKRLAQAPSGDERVILLDLDG